MSLERFRRCVALKGLRDGDRDWFPKWFVGYVKFHKLSELEPEEPADPARQEPRPPGCDPPGCDVEPAIEVTEARVLAYLRNLRDTNVPAWRRLQAAKAIELYQNVILRTETVDFVPIRKKLLEIAAHEKRLTVQELLGHKDVKTTMIYSHVMNRPGMSVVSPSDRLDLVPCSN